MSLKDDITVLPSNIQDELNTGSTCEECAEALSDYIIKLQADNTLLAEKVKELEKELHLSLIQRDHWEENATTLAMAVGENCGIDVGEHSSDNCPVLTALEALGQ